MPEPVDAGVIHEAGLWGARATVIDASASMVELALHQVPQAEFHVWPLGTLPWGDNTFDVVTAFNALFFARGCRSLRKS